LAVVNFIIDTVKDRIPIVVGIGGNNTQHVVSEIKSFNFDKISAVLSVSPYYNKPNQKGLYNHYKHIAAACPLPIILYNVPGRTHVNISAKTSLALANDFDNIVAVKEASGDLEQISQIIADKPEDFKVISGDDMLTLAILAIGGCGVISVTANAFPQEFSQMVRYALHGEYSKARKIHLSLVHVINSFFTEGNPAGVKVALRIKDLMQNHLRLPLARVSKSHYQKIAKLIEDYESKK